MKPFATRFPSLWHVADRAALPGIRRHGLLSAATLCRLHGVTLPEANRRAYLRLAEGAALRWQGMSDAAMATRLLPGLEPAAWRHLINGMVFLFAAARGAERLRNREAERDQVLLRFETAALLRSGLFLRACRYNNGFADRSSPAKRRLRGPADYVPVGDWGAGTPREVVVTDATPPGIGFSVQECPLG